MIKLKIVWIFNQKQGFLIPLYPLTNFEIPKYYKNEPSFKGVYSRDNLPDKIKDWVYVINFYEYSDIETHWIALYALNNNVTYTLIVLVLKIFQKKLKYLLINLLL